MPSSLNEYQTTSTDWRKSLRQNNFRTTVVIGLFVLIYGSVGFLIDLYVSSNLYPDASMTQLIHALVHFDIFPLSTSILLVVAGGSLLVSYAFYDRLMLLGTDYHEITPTTTQNIAEKQLYNVVDEMRIAAGLRYMPRVFIIKADYMNAFASGFSEKSAMVAITQGLLDKLTRDEMQAVMAHEISHIRHLDIKLTLTASLLANLTLMVLDIFFYNMIYSNRRNNNNRKSDGIFTIILMLRYLLPIINILLLLYLSRTRELMADAGCVELMRNNEPLASALLKIQGDHVENQQRYNEAYQQTPHENVRRDAYIFDPIEAGIEGKASISDLFSTHPSLETRLKAIGFTKKSA